MIRLETESLLQVQQSMWMKFQAGDLIVRRRRLTIAPGMIGEISIMIPSKTGIYKQTDEEVDEQIRELNEIYGQELAETGAVMGPPLALRGNGRGYEPALTIYSDASEEQIDTIRNIVGFDILMLRLHVPAPQIEP